MNEPLSVKNGDHLFMKEVRNVSFRTNFFVSTKSMIPFQTSTTGLNIFQIDIFEIICFLRL